MNLSLQKIQTSLFFTYLTFYMLGTSIYSSHFFVMCKFLLQILFIASVCMGKKHYNGKAAIWIAVMTTVFCLAQLFSLGNSKIVSLLFNVWLFACLSQVSTKKLLLYWGLSFQLLTTFISVDVLWVCLSNNEFRYFRYEVIVDKSFITLFYSMTFIFCLTHFFMNRRRTLNFLILSFNLFVNVFIVQSKISISVFFLCLTIMIIFGVTNKKRELMYFALGCGIVLTVIHAILPNQELPNEISYAINKLYRDNLYGFDRVQSQQMELTYDIRHALWAYALSLFYAHPILGIGIGNFVEHKFVYSRDFVITQTESSFINILTEGGLIYFMIIFFLFCKGINCAYLKFKKFHDPDYILCFTFFCSYLLLIFGNDFMDSIFWIMMGLFMGVLAEKETAFYK